MKQKWGKFFIGQGFFYIGPRAIPMRIMIQLPYDWNLTHTNDHVARYWAKRRKGDKNAKTKTGHANG